jgi:hypothetical protein
VKLIHVDDVDALVGSTSVDGSPTLGLGRAVPTKARSTVAVAAAGSSSSHAPRHSHHQESPSCPRASRTSSTTEDLLDGAVRGLGRTRAPVRGPRAGATELAVDRTIAVRSLDPVDRTVQRKDPQW